MRNKETKVNFAPLFRDAQVDIYSGSIPVNSNTTEPGTLLISCTGLKCAGSKYCDANPGNNASYSFGWTKGNKHVRIKVEDKGAWEKLKPLERIKRVK